jgi:hypothetical protein
MSKVSVKGVLIGGIVDIVTSVVLGLPFALYAMLKVDLSHTPNAQEIRKSGNQEIRKSGNRK